MNLNNFSVSADSIGKYEVIVESKHPGKGYSIKLKKVYHVDK